MSLSSFCTEASEGCCHVDRELGGKILPLLLSWKRETWESEGWPWAFRGICASTVTGYKRLLTEESLGCPCSEEQRVSISSPSTGLLLYKRCCADESEGWPCAGGVPTIVDDGIDTPPYNNSWVEESEGWPFIMLPKHGCEAWFTTFDGWVSWPDSPTEEELG